jgi:tetratricopeptide (TPR) repeat protein
MRFARFGLLLLTFLGGLWVYFAQGDDPKPAPEDPFIGLIATARAELINHAPFPPSSRAPLTAARIHLQAGRPERARALILPELEGEWSAEAHYLLGILESRAQLWQRTLDALTLALTPGAAYPEKPIAPFRLARALEETGRIPAARLAYQLDHDLSGDGEALFRLGLLDIEAGHFPKAKANLENALGRFTQPQARSRTLAALSDISLASNDLSQARDLLEQAAVLHQHPELLHRLAQLCRRMGDTEAAAGYAAEAGE